MNTPNNNSRNGSALFAKFLSSDKAPQAKELARKLGVSVGLVSHWRNGRTKPSLDRAVALQLVTHNAVPAWAWLSDEYSTELLQMISASAVPVAPPCCETCGQVLPEKTEKKKTGRGNYKRSASRKHYGVTTGATGTTTAVSSAVGK